MIHTKTLVAGLYHTSALASLAAFGSGGAVGASACAVAYVRRTHDGREMYAFLSDFLNPTVMSPA